MMKYKQIRFNKQLKNQTVNLSGLFVAHGEESPEIPWLVGMNGGHNI